MKRLTMLSALLFALQIGIVTPEKPGKPTVQEILDYCDAKRGYIKKIDLTLSQLSFIDRFDAFVRAANVDRKEKFCYRINFMR